jgi:hypothetical protein
MIKKLIKTCLPILMMYISKEQYEPLLPSPSINNINDHSNDFLRRSHPRRLIKLS